jgi:hypothetical protein
MSHHNTNKKRATTRSRLIASASVATVLAVLAIWQLDSRSAAPPALQDVLSVSVAGPPLHLYSGEVDSHGASLDSAERSYDVPTDNGLGTKLRMVRNKDHSTTDIFFQEDGQRKAFANAFYAILLGESIRRDKGHVVYTADGDTVGSEEWFRLSGSRERVGHLLEGGNYSVFTFFDDGKTEASETLVAPGPDWAGRVQIMVREQRWHNDKDHTLAYRDLLNPDFSRDQMEWDGALNPIRNVHLGSFGVDGTTVKLYYPGGHSLRLETSSDWFTTKGQCYRIDGTLFWRVTRTLSKLTPTYYDASGTVPVFEQTWSRSEITENGKARELWDLAQIKEFAADGSPSRELQLKGKRVTEETRFKGTADGVAYDTANFFYREDGTLERVKIYLADTKIKTVEHAAQEKIQAVVAPAELALPENIDELPVPLSDPPSN